MILYHSECVNAVLRTLRVRKSFLTSVITSLAFGSCCKLTLVRKRFIALVS